jgi:hypothetical protein
MGYGYKLKENQDPKEFHAQRIEGFEKISDKLFEIASLLRKAKSDTKKYYEENPDSYAVVYGTDLIQDYLDDIIELLKK